MSVDEFIAATRAAERARCASITGHEEAKGREALALHLAIDTDMAVEEAVAMLAAAPRAEPSRTLH